MRTDSSPSLLGKALARCLSESPGLTAAYMPINAPLPIIQALVDEANRIKDAASGEPYALICSADAIEGAITPAEAIQYRSGDRLVVVVGQHPELSSFVQAFVEQLGPDYPHNASHSTSLESLGRAALDAVLETAEVQSGVVVDREAASGWMTDAMDLLKWLYQESPAGMAVWNTYWLTHVDSGLHGLAHYVKTSTAQSLDSLLRSGIPAAMSLPARNPVASGGKAAASNLDEAITNSWASADNVRHSARQITARRQDDDTEGLDWFTGDHWDDLGSRSSDIGTDHPFTAFHTLGLETSPKEHISALSTLDWSEFCSPDGAGEREVLVRLAADKALPLDEVGTLTTPSIVAVAPDGHLHRSARLAIGLPLAAPTDSPEDVPLAFTARSLAWESANAAQIDGDHLWVTGWITSTSPNRLGRTKIEAKPHPQAAIRTFLANATSEALVIPVAFPSVTTMNERKSRGKDTVGRPSLAISQDPDQPTVVPMPEKGGVLTLVAPVDDSTPTLDGQALTPWHDRRLYFAHFNPGESHTIEAGGHTFDCSGVQDKTEFVSPIEAAIRQSIVVGTSPSPSEHGVRGWYEDLAGRDLSTPDWQAAHGHVMVATDHPAREHLVLDDERRAMVPKDLADHWRKTSSSYLPREIYDSEEAKEFRTSFAALGLEEHLTRRTKDGEFKEWPSRTSWRGLADSPELANYLRSYAKLVEHAKEEDPFGLFWAAFPFSVSAWDVHSSFHCLSVLLSPLHPIRLAWLAGVEDVLWEAPEAQALAMAGLVEGWNLPMHGPGSDEGEALLAVPIDSGEAGQFLGWSQLVRISAGAPDVLAPPPLIGGMNAPGAASSGLNGAAASSALRSYRRLNPHVTTLTVDLAAGADAPRLQEVDDALLKVVGEWVKDPDILPGGVRVADSLHRRGPIPVESVERQLLNGNAVPITWQRYEGKSPRANIRLLQESGIKVSMQQTRGKEGGVLGSHGLRRLEAPTGEVKRRQFSSFPGLVSTQTPLQQAIAAVEGFMGSAQLKAQVVNTSLVSSEADWSVSGEGLLSPAALSALINNATDGEQMLWEWQPPMLSQQARETVVQRRPYISVVRIPGGFRQSLSSLVKDCSSGGDVQDILTTLGVRGVGLSSLVAIGGAHAAGALGFYLTFKLLESMEIQGADVLVLPMDACDAFLRALAFGEDGSDVDSKQRADLLAIVLQGSDVTLIPIEIKFYKATGTTGVGTESPLPGAGSHELQEARAQALKSADLMEAIKRRKAALDHFDPTQSSAEQALWNTAFASLVEAGFKLSSTEPSHAGVTEVLQSLLDDGVKLHTGSPLVAYYQLGSSSGTHRSGTHHAGSGDPAVGALVAESRAAFAQVDNPSSEISAVWKSLFEWSLNGAMDIAVAKPADGGPRPSQANATELLSKTAQPARPGDDAGAPNADTAPDTNSSSGLRAPRASVPTREEPAPTPAPLTRETCSPSTPQSPTPPRTGIQFTVGHRLDTPRQEPAIYWPSNTDLTQMNMGVVGDLGTGKTQFLKALMLQLRTQAKTSQPSPLSILVFDYKRDFVDDGFLEAVGGKLLRPFGLPLNVFARGQSIPFERAQAFIDILSKIFNIGHVQRFKLNESIMEAYAAADPMDPTLEEVYEIYKDKLDGDADSVLSVLYNFVKGGIFTSDRDQMVTFEELMDDSVVVLNLSSLGTDQNSKNALVALFLNFYYEYMLSRPKWPFVRGDDGVQLRRLNSYLLIDEASNIMKYDFDMLDQLLTQGREFGIGVVLSSQYLNQFKTKGYNYGTPLRSWFIHRVPHVSPAELRTLGLVDSNEDTARRIQSQQVFQCYYRSLGVSGAFMRTKPYFEIAESPYD